MDTLDSSRVEIRLASGYRSFFDRFLLERFWNYLDYQSRHRILSGVERRIDVSFDGDIFLSVTVPESVFNPYKGSAPGKVIELIMSEKVDVKGRRVVDLGCGSGVIGLTAIHKGAASVLFSDINPHVASLKHDPRLRDEDQLVVQDGLARTVSERGEPFDLVIAILPGMIAEQKVESASYEVGVKRLPDLLMSWAEESCQILRPGGQILFYVSLPSSAGLRAYDAFLSRLRERFDPDSYRVLAHQHLRSLGGDHFIFEATKRDAP